MATNTNTVQVAQPVGNKVFGSTFQVLGAQVAQQHGCSATNVGKHSVSITGSNATKAGQALVAAWQAAWGAFGTAKAVPGTALRRKALYTQGHKAIYQFDLALLRKALPAAPAKGKAPAKPATPAPAASTGSAA